jgi:hypothetical protein
MVKLTEQSKKTAKKSIGRDKQTNSNKQQNKQIHK